MKNEKRTDIITRLVRFSRARVSRSLLDVASSRLMKSGLVVLRPGESVGWHVTAGKEEVIIVLSGTATITCGRKAPFAAVRHCLVYIPPETEHNVSNTGQDVLRYVYVVSRVK